MPPQTSAEQAQDLRDSVRDYRDSRTSAREREAITQWWATMDVPNQMAAMLRAAEIDDTPTV